jgi:hypothetical protein
MTAPAVLDSPDLQGTHRQLDAAGGELVAAYMERVADRPALPAILSESGQLRELYRLMGHDPDSPEIRALVERGQPPMAGGATGQQATAYMANLPSEGSYVMNPDAFATETERNDMPLETKAIAGLGGAPIDLRIPNVGVLANIRLIVKGTLTVGGTGAVTSTYQWPWNLFKRVTVNLQGQTSLFSCEGLDLRQRRQRIYRRPTDTVSTAPATAAGSVDPVPGVIANGTYSVVLVYDVPIVHDPYTLVGAVYAQSDAVYLNWRIQLGAQAELFTVAAGGTVAFTGTIYSTITFYDIPFQDTQQGRRVLLPDLRWLHSLISSDKPFANTGDVDTELIRTAGQLLSVAAYVDNGGAAQIAPATLARVVFMYGGNRQPRVFDPIEMLLEKNVQDYNGLIGPGWVILDFEVDNPKRELVYPKGVTELKLRANVPAGTTINANAKTHVVSETLFAGS